MSRVSRHLACVRRGRVERTVFLKPRWGRGSRVDVLTAGESFLLRVPATVAVSRELNREILPSIGTLEPSVSPACIRGTIPFIFRLLATF